MKNNFAKENTKRGIEMFTHRFTMNNMEAKRISFTAKGKRLKYIVEATKEVHFFIVNDKEWENYSNGKVFKWFNKYIYGEYVSEVINLPTSGSWNLIIANSSGELARFNFEVYTLEDWLT